MLESLDTITEMGAYLVKRTPVNGAVELRICLAVPLTEWSNPLVLSIPLERELESSDLLNEMVAAYAMSLRKEQ